MSTKEGLQEEFLAYPKQVFNGNVLNYHVGKEGEQWFLTDNRGNQSTFTCFDDVWSWYVGMASGLIASTGIINSELLKSLSLTTYRLQKFCMA